MKATKQMRHGYYVKIENYATKKVFEYKLPAASALALERACKKRLELRGVLTSSSQWLAPLRNLLPKSVFDTFYEFPNSCSTQLIYKDVNHRVKDTLLILR